MRVETETDEPITEQVIEAVEPVEQAEVAEGEQPEEDQELVVQIGDEEAPVDEEAAAPQWVKDLRRANREKDKRIRELEAAQVVVPEVKTLGPKPTLESCGYDEDEFETKLTAWHEDKRKADKEQEDALKAQQDAQAAWQAKLASYEEGKGALNVRDYDDAEDVAKELFNDTQRGIVIHGAENPALLTYAIGKNRKKAEELAAIKDPVQFAFAVAKMETQLKVSNRNRTVPQPEKTISSSGSLAGAVDGTLDRLRAEAERTNDYSKVMAYKKQQRAKG